MITKRRTTSRIAAGAIVFAAITGLAATQASAVVAPPIPAPAGLKVVRAGADLQTLNISWKPVTGATRYTVNVFDGTNQYALNVAADKTSYAYKASGNCTRYRVNVMAIGARGSATTADTIIAPLAPGGIKNVVASRTDAGVTVSLKWDAPPVGSSYEPVKTYKVLFRSIIDNKVLLQRDSADTTEKVTGLDPARTYVAEIVPTNTWGFCNTSKIVLNGPRPTAPTNVKVVRDTNESQYVNVSWTAPVWTGYSKVSKVQVGVRNPAQRDVKWIDLPATATSAKIKLPNDSKWSVWVRVFSGDVAGELTKEYVLGKSGDDGTPAVDRNVSISESGGKVLVKFGAPVGTIAAYPKVNVAIAPTTTDNGFSANQDVINRAQTFTFDSVPCGAYTVVVTGIGELGSQEFARKMINRCTVGLVPANQWKLVSGQATIAGNAVDMVFGNEARVVSTVPRVSKDMVYSTQATLQSGSGYGIWTRAALDTSSKVSGYSFQFDPGYAGVDAKFGKALLLRVWNNGTECSNPIAKVKWPEGLSINGTHEVTVVTRGDTLYATIDGTKMFDVASLKQALADSKCGSGYPEPTGTQVGFRTWSSTGKATFRNTTIN